MSRELLEATEPTAGHMGLYMYRGRIESIYDGDTMRITVDQGFSTARLRESFRLYGINTPEVRGAEKEEGKKVRDYVRSFLPIGQEVYVRSVRDKSGKYGRYLGVIWVEKPDGWVNVNKHLLDNNMAVEMLY